MQVDFHYHATYCLARAAGIKKRAAKVIAYSSAYVDSSTAKHIDDHNDGSKIIAVPTAHHTMDLIRNLDRNDQREIWVPFHFFPGGRGDTFTSKLICRKDSALVKEMVKNHLQYGKKSYALHLIGIAAHVYADTFAHYGFSGVSSRKNRVDGSTISITQSTEMSQIVLGSKLSDFFTKYGRQGGILKNIRSVMSAAGEIGSGALGHGGTSIYPDQPFLKWSFEYEYPDLVANKLSDRNNQKTFLVACEKLYDLFTEFLAEHKEYFDLEARVEFREIKKKIKEILALEAHKTERANAWTTSLRKGELIEKKEKLPEYDPNKWEDERSDFVNLTKSTDAAKLDIYKFYQAASYHKHYVLRELLPKYGIIIV